jgi:short-subunit dehydrogenase
MIRSNRLCLLAEVVMAVCTIIGMGPGLGLAIARRFGRAGFAIGMVARKQETLAAAGEALDADGITCASVVADAASEASLGNAIAELTALQGDAQILIYNAFTDHRVLPTQLSLEDMIADFRVNVGGALVAMQAVAPAMIRHGNGAILMTGGGYALRPAAGRSSLGLSKAALRNLAMCLALELEPQGVRVGTVTIFGQIKPNTVFSPEQIAEEFFAIAHEPPGMPNERQFRG